MKHAGHFRVKLLGWYVWHKSTKGLGKRLGLVCKLKVLKL